MDFPLVVHVVGSRPFQAVVLSAGTLEQFLRLLLILVVDVREVEVLEEHLELISNNRLVAESVYLP